VACSAGGTGRTALACGITLSGCGLASGAFDSASFGGTGFGSAVFTKAGRTVGGIDAGTGAAAADRIAAIFRIHRHLHAFNGAQAVAIKRYLEELSRDFSTMLSVGSRDRLIAVEGIEINLPAAIAIPLGFIANELITNAAKYGTGKITLSLESNPEKGYLLSVSNEGPGLPEGFDLAQRDFGKRQCAFVFVQQLDH